VQAMSEKNLHMDPESIIAKYLAGEATSSEVKWLEEWVRQDEENKNRFLQSRQAFYLTSSKTKLDFDVDSAFRKVGGALEEKRGKIVSFRPKRNRLLQAVAAVAILIIAAFWYYQNTMNDGITLNAESMVLVDALPDGSIVSLNRNSEVKFKQQNERQVILKGDAFFEVKRDEQNPFIVHAGEVKVRVLGTSFYVNAQDDHNFVEVMVRSGRVAVHHGVDSLILSAGQSARYHPKDKSLVQSKIADINYLSWKTKTLIFEDEALANVLGKINAVYDTHLVLENKSLDNCQITVTFKDQGLDAVLSVIAETLDLDVQQKDGQILLSGRGCQ
jgi:transmembrane sensor